MAINLVRWAIGIILFAGSVAVIGFALMTGHTGSPF